MLPQHSPACAAGFRLQIDLPTTTDAAPCAGANRKLLSTEPRVLPLPKGILSPELLNGDAFVEIYWRWFLRDEKAWQLNSPWRSAIIPFKRFNKEKVIGDGAYQAKWC